MGGGEDRGYPRRKKKKEKKQAPLSQLGMNEMVP